MANNWVAKKQYAAIQNALKPFERELISFYEVEWLLKSRVPDIEAVTEHLRIKFPQIKQVTVNYSLSRHPVRKALKDRGIPFELHSRTELSATQVAAAVTVMNFADDRPIKVKLEQLGINPSQYYAWQNDPQFQTLLDTLQHQNIKNIKPTAVAELTKKINAGDWNAIKFYLEATGTVKADNAPQSETQVMLIVEIIQRHVKDEAVMRAISADIINVLRNRTLEVVETPAIEGTVVDSEELADARKQLGV